jgi:large subunit ribosomal protein L18
MKIKHNKTLAQKRAQRVRGKMQGTAQKPRVSVYRSNKQIFVQAIDDDKGVTLASVHEKSQVKKAAKKTTPTKGERASLVGEELGKLLKAKKIKLAVFDRGANKYHGRTKAVAEGLRSQEIKV